MKLFIGIELPKNVRAESMRMLSELKKCSRDDGKFEPSDRMHITLRYLGETNNMAGAVASMKKAVEGIRPFSLHLGTYSYFEKRETNSKTSYISVKGDLHELNMLYYALSAALTDEGFPSSAKGYTPHVTLGRSVIHDDVQTEKLRAINPPLNASMLVNSIVLFESAYRNGRKEYVPLHREKL